MINKCSKGIWEACIVMEHKEKWCPKAQTCYKLLVDPTMLGTSSNCLLTPHPQQTTSNACTHTQSIFQGGIHQQMEAKRWGGI